MYVLQIQDKDELTLSNKRSMKPAVHKAKLLRPVALWYTTNNQLKDRVEETTLFTITKIKLYK